MWVQVLLSNYFKAALRKCEEYVRLKLSLYISLHCSQETSPTNRCMKMSLACSSPEWWMRIAFRCRPCLTTAVKIRSWCPRENPAASSVDSSLPMRRHSMSTWNRLTRRHVVGSTSVRSATSNSLSRAIYEPTYESTPANVHSNVPIVIAPSRTRSTWWHMRGRTPENGLSSALLVRNSSRRSVWSYKVKLQL